MPKEIASISNMLTEWNLLRESARKKTVGLFIDSSKLDTINRLTKSLNINETMGINDLANALKIIESINIKPNLLSPKIPMGQWLDSTRNRTLKDLDASEKVPVSNITIDRDSALFRLLVKNHKTLLNFYEVASARARGELPVSQVSYTKEQIATSQAFHDIIETTQELNSSDKSTSANDFKRQAATIYGAYIRAGDQDSNQDPIILETIENFAGDKISTPHSRANKIFNFGGQYMGAAILHEFGNTTMFADTQKSGLQRGSITGQFNWSKNPATQEIYATVDLKIFSCVYADPEDRNAPQSFFAIGSDGVSLVPLNDDELEKTLSRCDLERKHITEDKVTPVCQLTAKIALVQGKTGYHLQVQEFTNKFYTDALVSTKAPTKEALDQHLSMPKP